MEKNLIIDLSKITKKILINDIFYGLFLSTINKMESTKIPLAAVGLNKSTMDFCLMINPEEWFKYSDEVKYGVLKHEALHLCMFHLLSADTYSNQKLDNVACDLEINQYIPKQHLPSWGIFLNEFQTKYPALNLAPQKGRHYYYHELSKMTDEQKEELGIDEKAEHHWVITDSDGNDVDALTDAEKNAIKVSIESTIEAITTEIQKSQGHVPAEIEQLIKNFVKPKPAFNYLKYVRNFVGNSDKYFIRTSKIRENQRFPGQPKTVLKPTAKILILIDESGSVSEKELFDFLNEIYHLKKKINIEIRAFDTQVSDIVKYKGNNEFPRTRCGGTSFTAAVDYYNQSKYTTCIVFTDGHAETPPPCFKRLLWVISSNGNEEAIKNHSLWIKIPSNV
jgi:predicted metal-dependent peptidase